MYIIKHKKIFVLISVCLTILAIVSMSVFGFRPGIDFKGGTSIEVAWADGSRAENTVLKETIKSIPGAPEVLIQPLGQNSFVLKMHEITPTEREVLTASINGAFPGMSVASYTTIGPSVGKELARKSIMSIILVSLGIVIFIAVAFRKVSYPIKSWKYGVIAITTLLHDVIIPTGIFVALSYYNNIEIDTLFVVSLLTILGLSVSDTIVVFDRIRENLRTKNNGNFEEIVGKSITEVYQRSIATALTVMFALAALAVFGPESTRLLAIMLGAGMFFGTYSSIFLASPLLVVWQEYTDRNKKLKRG